jgi:hypothetical protein
VVCYNINWIWSFGIQPEVESYFETVTQRRQCAKAGKVFIEVYWHRSVNEVFQMGRL